MDLLKLDIEGADFAVLERLCQTGAISRIKHLVCELHVRRDCMDDMLRTLAMLRAAKLELSVSAAAVPWLGLAGAEAPFEAVGRNQILAELYGWRTGEAAATE